MKTITAPTMVMALLASVALTTPRMGLADDNPYPQYKPSSRSPAALDIRSNAYGASADAPQALSIGDRAPDFSAPRSGGGLVSLRTARKQGSVVLIFYRGHW